MILEVARALTDWFNDGTHGIVAQLAILPLEDGDTAPTVGTIADQTRNNLVAENRFPSSPGIAVTVQQIPMLDGTINTVTGDGTADVLVRIGRDDTDSMNAMRDTSYILRAIVRSWRLFNQQARTRNGIQIYDCPKLAIAPTWGTIDDLTITGAANGHLTFRDLNTT